MTVVSSSSSPSTPFTSSTLNAESTGFVNFGGVFGISSMIKLNFDSADYPEEVFATTRNGMILGSVYLIVRVDPLSVTILASSPLNGDFERDTTLYVVTGQFSPSVFSNNYETS